MSEILTATRLRTLRRCPRQHYYRYELGLSRIRTADALRLGSAFHRGLELYRRGVETTKATEEAISGYATIPEWADSYNWHVECETVRALLMGYFWYYLYDDIKIIEVEQTYDLPLVNLWNDQHNQRFTLAGKIDAIGYLPDGCKAVIESKTAGEDISPDSDYWLRLRHDPQVAHYVIAARELGYDVVAVVYDVTRKPTISPLRTTPIEKRRYRKDGKLYAAQRESDETPEDYGVRLLTDIGSRPDYYYQRREVPCLDDDLADFRVELWQQAEHLLDSRQHDRWFRNFDRFTCSVCEFVDLCYQSVRVTADQVPAGFQKLTNIHPELQTEGAQT